MADSTAAQPASAPGDRTVIGISFGNSSSSIAVTVDDKAEVIANEDGGEDAPRPTYRRGQLADCLRMQTAKYRPSCPTLTATSTTAARRRPSWCATRTTPLPTSRTLLAKSTDSLPPRWDVLIALLGPPG